MTACLQCELPPACRGLCHTHYQYARRHGLLNGLPYAETVNHLARDELGRKRCHGCEEWLELDRFVKNVQSPDGHRARCKDCVYGPEGERAHMRRLACYGIDQVRLDQLLAACAEACPICLIRFADCTPPGYTVDHDHNCCGRLRSCGKCVRGLLCRQCNGGIGSLRDSREALGRAIDYLDEWEIKRKMATKS